MSDETVLILHRKSSNEDFVKEAVRVVKKNGIKLRVLVPFNKSQKPRIVNEALERGATRIIAGGGDGTVNEVVNGMAGSRVPLALLPAGTGNVLAKELGLPWDIWRAAEYIPAGEVRRIALGRAGERYFICMAGVGVDANTVYRLSVQTKLSLGMLAYWIESFRQLLEYEFPLFSVRVEGQSFQAALLVVSRTKNYGGPVQLTRRADLFSDEFEVCLFQRRNRFLYLLYFLALQAGLLERFRDVHFLRTRRVEAQPGNQRIQVQVDGELAGALPMDFVIVPEALSLLVPRPGGR